MEKLASETKETKSEGNCTEENGEKGAIAIGLKCHILNPQPTQTGKLWGGNEEALKIALQDEVGIGGSLPI